MSKPKKLRWYAGGIVVDHCHVDHGAVTVCLPERWRVKAVSAKEAMGKISELAFLNERQQCHVWVMPVVGNDDPSLSVCSGKPSAGIENADKN